MIWYFLWKQEDPKRTSLYDCDICTLATNQWFKKRVCFHPLHGKEVYPFKLPVFNQELKKIENGISKTEFFTQEDFLEWLYDTNDYYKPEMPSFEFIRALINSVNNTEVCLTAFVDEALASFIELEAACTEYKQLPDSGGVLDQLNIYLEAFMVIRNEKIRYENQRNKKLMDDLKAPTSTSSSKVKTPRKR